MTEEERKSMEQKIRATIEALHEHTAALEFSIQQIPPDNTLDSSTRREAINHKRACEAKIRDAIRRAARLEAALKRVGSPDFGICIGCEKPIEMEKLKEAPEAFYCANCGKD